MMRNNFSFYLLLRIWFVVGMFIVATITYQQLPQIVPTHWDINGVVDGWSDKSVGAFLFPGMSLLLLVLFPLLSRLDPKKENYEHFKHAWNKMQTIVIGLLTYIYGIQLYFTLNPETDQTIFVRLILIGIGALFMLLGNILGKIRQNYFIGFRTPWSLNDPEVWQKSQRVAGWTMVLAGVAFIITAFIPALTVYVFIAAILAVVVVPTVYSYRISRKD